MSKKVVSVIAAVLFLGPALCQLCFAKGFHGPPCDFERQRPNPKCMQKAVQELGLSVDQQAAMEELKNETCNQIEPLVEQIIAVELYKALLAEEIDETEVAAKIAEVVELKSRIGTIKLQSQMAVSQIVTPEQRQLLLDKIEECKQQGSGGKGRRGRR